MKMLLRKSNKRGISTVLTTLIIVVASVVLGTAVTLFGTSLFQSGSQQSAISVSNQHLWYHSDALANQATIGAFVVRNTGDKVVAIDSITIRGASVPFTDLYFALDTDTGNSGMVASIRELGKNTTRLANPGCGTATGATTLCLDLDASTAAGTSLTVKQAQGPITLQTGKTAVVYYIIPSGKITASDSGASTSVSVFAGSAGSVQTVSVAQV